MTDAQNPHPLGLTPEEVALSYTTKDAPLVRYGAQISDSFVLTQATAGDGPPPGYFCPSCNGENTKCPEGCGREGFPGWYFYQRQNSDGVPVGEKQVEELVRLVGDENDEFSFYSDSHDCVITQHRYYRWGDIVLAVGEINEPNTWDDAYFDAKCAELETAFARITELEAHIAAESARMLAVVERCAKVAEDVPWERHDDCSFHRSRIVAAIRTQGTSHEG